MKQTLTDIFAPTVTKVLASISLAFLLHTYLIEEAIRHSASSEVLAAQHFWVSGLIDALPYLKTNNPILKFFTFFLLAYVVIWVFSKLAQIVDRIQLTAVKLLRRNA